MVMATGIVSLALNGAGYRVAATLLLGLNVFLYGFLTALLLIRSIRHRLGLFTDLTNHALAPSFFTLVAAPCVLGCQFLVLLESQAAGMAFWGIGSLFWFLLTYLMIPGLMEVGEKPKIEKGLNGAWLLTVVGTQSVSVLASLLAPAARMISPEILLFVSLLLWLVGSMLYLWLIALIFHRILFLPLSPEDLTPPYWINMGAVAISTLAGATLIDAADRMPLLLDLLPFLKGMTLLFWATGTWWIPVLLALGVWRHLIKRVPLTYEHGYWAVVFPLGMYTACTQSLIRVFRLPFLSGISGLFLWLAVLAWGVTFVGFLRSLAERECSRPVR